MRNPRHLHLLTSAVANVETVSDAFREFDEGTAEQCISITNGHE